MPSRPARLPGRAGRGSLPARPPHTRARPAPRRRPAPARGLSPAPPWRAERGAVRAIAYGALAARRPAIGDPPTATLPLSYPLLALLGRSRARARLRRAHYTQPPAGHKP